MNVKYGLVRLLYFFFPGKLRKLPLWFSHTNSFFLNFLTILEPFSINLNAKTHLRSNSIFYMANSLSFWLIWCQKLTLKFWLVFIKLFSISVFSKYFFMFKQLFNCSLFKCKHQTLMQHQTFSVKTIWNSLHTMPTTKHEFLLIYVSIKLD